MIKTNCILISIIDFLKEMWKTFYFNNSEIKLYLYQFELNNARYQLLTLINVFKKSVHFCISHSKWYISFVIQEIYLMEANIAKILTLNILLFTQILSSN